MQPKRHLKGCKENLRNHPIKGWRQSTKLKSILEITIISFAQNMNNCNAKKRVSLEVSRGLHDKIKKLANEREETMVSLVISALHEFLESEHDIKFDSKSSHEINSQLNTYKFNSHSITIA